MLNVTLWWDTSWSWFFLLRGRGEPSAPSLIITEDGNNIITEDSNDMITE
jgi:hypothetical protein